MHKDAAIAVYKEQLDSLAAVRDRCAGLVPETSSPADLQRMRLVLEIVNTLESIAASNLEDCYEAERCDESPARG